MKRLLAAALAAGMLAGAALPVRALDGHGNAENIERSVPNTGGVAGGPAHRNDPRVQEAQDGRPHSDNDGHRHGHGHGKK